MLDGQGGEKAANLLVAKLDGGPTADKGLKPDDPKAIGFERPGGVIAEFDSTFQVAEFPFPRGSVGRSAHCQPDGRGAGASVWRAQVRNWDNRSRGRFCWKMQSRELMIKARISRIGAQEKSYSSCSVMSLFNGVLFGCEFGEKRAERGRCRRREIVFLAEIEIKPNPFAVVRSEGLRHMCLVEAALETAS